MIQTALLTAVGFLLATPALAETQVILAGNLLADVGVGPTGPATITVTDGRIVSIAKGMDRAALPANATVIDLSNRTVLPGLIDLHVHLTGDPGGDFRDEAVDPDEWAL